MIRTVVREHHWLPSYVDTLYADDIDHHGIQFWFEDIKECYKKPPKK